MVSEQLVGRGISEPRLLAAMGVVERHRFVEAPLVGAAYEDRPLPIGHGQTISQPYMVARATELAAPRPEDRALEVGAGSGYQAAILAQLCAEVFAIEIVPQLAERARRALAETHTLNVTVEAFDGSGGWPAHAPYDVIIVSAGAPRIPTLLVGELADGGRLVIPVGGPHEQELALVRRVGNDYQTSFETRCRYVDLRGRFGVGGGVPAA
jgi:protein-L-isoaspartate(D-aspartate) O-methyltransferase